MAGERDDGIARRSFDAGASGGRARRYSLQRRQSNISEVSVATEVGMAQDEMFSGPISESFPTSASAFSHRRNRADSTVSFTFYDDDHVSEEVASEEWSQWEEDEEAIEDSGFAANGGTDTVSDEDLELGESLSSRRRKSSSGISRTSIGQPLLRRKSDDSARSDFRRTAGRTNQKLYIPNEDLTIVLAGFDNSTLGVIAYTTICALTFGLAYLVLRWLPRWRILLVGRPSPLRECSWLVVENQWGEASILDVGKKEYGRSLASIFGPDDKLTQSDYDEDHDFIVKQLVYLDYRYIRLFFHPLKDKFVLGNHWKDPNWTDALVLRTGLDYEDKESRELVFGQNSIEIEEKSMGKLLVDEAFHPFYIFQIASLILWSLDEYYYYATCIFFISLVSIVTTLIETRTTMRRLREISRFECDVRVLRNGFWRNVDSTELVPGDVYEISDPNLTQFPCDSSLLSGDCIVNESMLTGESVPVSKSPLTNDALELMDLSAAAIHPEVAKHMLFSGTKIIRARRPQNDKDDEGAALAMVVRTGFNTTKGSLVRSMLFPKPSGFKFYRDSFRYISVMAIIAMVGFIASIFNFVSLGLAWHLIIVRALDLITIVVPPALPATLTIGTNFALSRLKKKQIFCISPQRVNVGGKLDVICFDKTGTLTEEGLDVLGVMIPRSDTKQFTDILPDAFEVMTAAAALPNKHSMARTILFTMATCHSLRVIDGELLGDPLDVKMFEFTGWTFEEGENNRTSLEGEEHTQLRPSIARPPAGSAFASSTSDVRSLELGVLRVFEFVSHLRRASVIVREFGSQRGSVYVKGAPECMREICRPESLPADYEETLSYYTHKGFRIIACAAKAIPKLNWVKVQKMRREDVEADLDFAGFIVFENKLKPTTAAVISELSAAGLRKVMCTGDNILTAVSVARECGLMGETVHCFVPHFVEGDSRTPLARLEWESLDNPAFRLNEHTLKPLPPPRSHDASLPYSVADLRNYTIAVSGDVFRWIVDFASEKVLREVLVHCQVFARMSPDEKHELVEKLQSIDYTCGFCGDGANDCGALKAADVGISLSEAEASVAAPFTSRVFDISCVPEVIREGRAALVTSFSCFKYMSLYSAIQFISVSFLYASASNLGDFQYLYIDLLLILPIAVFMGWTGPFPKLARKRPTASLVSRKILTPLIGQMVICLVVQTIAFVMVRRQPWFIPPVIDLDHSNSLNSENSALFLVSCYQYILSSVVLSVGPPFRQPLYHNSPFVITLAVAAAVSTYMLFGPAHWLFRLLELTPMRFDFKLFLVLLAVVGFGMAWIAEMHVFPALARGIGRLRARANPQRPKKRKEYKIIEEQGRF